MRFIYEDIENDLNIVEGKIEDKSLEYCEPPYDPYKDGSSTEDDEDEIVMNSPLRLVENVKEGKLFYVYKSILFDIEEIEIHNRIAMNGRWMILMLRSGKFAAAIFDKGSLMPQHKTLSRYTNRAKQGGAQSKNDSAGGKALSAGAKLRRYNQLELEKDILSLLFSWKDVLGTLSRIFIVAPHKAKGSFLFKELDRSDKRIKFVPFITHTPTLEECKTIYEKLTTLHPFDSVSKPIIMESNIKKKEEVEEKKKKKKKEKREEEKEELEEEKGEILKEGNIYSNDDEIESFVKYVTAGDLVNIKALLTTKPLLVNSNFIFRNINNSTPLHAASIIGNLSLVSELLNAGANPESMDSHLRVPYLVSTTKGVRDCYRKFMGANLNKWNYEYTSIPSILTEEKEKEIKNKLKLKKKKAAERKKKEGRKKDESVAGEEGEEEEEEEEKEEKEEKKEKIKLLSDKLGLGFEFLLNIIYGKGEPREYLIESMEEMLACGILPHEILNSINFQHSSSAPPTVTTIKKSSVLLPSPGKYEINELKFNRFLLEDPPQGTFLSRIQFIYDGKKVVRRVDNTLPTGGLYELAVKLFPPLTKHEFELFTVMPTVVLEKLDTKPIAEKKFNGSTIQIKTLE